MNQKLILYFLIFFVFTACQSSDDTPRKTKSLKEDRTSVDNNNILREEEKKDANQEKTVFRYYDEVYEQTIAWNKAIDEQDKVGLKNIYARSIEAYGTRYSNSNLIKAKMKWFNNHPNYRQKIEKEVDVFFREIPVNGAKTIIYGSTFTKVAIENGKEKRYQAELLFKEENGKLKINLETDLTSLLNVENQTKGIVLPDGKYYFGTDAFYDTRRDETLAHEQVRVSSGITLGIKNGQIQKGFEYMADRYSGYMRGIVNAAIVSGEIDGDKIHLETVYYSDRDDFDLEYLKGKERDYTTLKVISKDKILVLKPKQGKTFPLTVGDYLYFNPIK